MLSFAVQKTTVLVQFETVHEPISGSTIANVNVFFLHAFEVLLPDPIEVLKRVSHWAFTEPRSFPRGCHDSTELFVFTPRVDELQDLDCH